MGGLDRAPGDECMGGRVSRLLNMLWGEVELRLAELVLLAQGLSGVKNNNIIKQLGDICWKFLVVL